MREHEVNHLNNFIMGWYIDPSVCDSVMSVYDQFARVDSDPLKYPPKFTKDIKDSNDFGIDAEHAGLISPYMENLWLCADEYSKKYKFSSGYTITEDIIIQGYPISGGYKVWHYERGPNHLKRHLVFMTYLNDVDDGGTDFLYQNLNVKAEKGLTILWPADWTFTHKSQISHTTEKYVVTGWFSLK
jgi:hypothetical protein